MVVEQRREQSICKRNLENLAQLSHLFSGTDNFSQGKPFTQIKDARRSVTDTEEPKCWRSLGSSSLLLYGHPFLVLFPSGVTCAQHYFSVAASVQCAFYISLCWNLS